MSFIGKNIRKIRTVKKLSQADFAKLFNLARPSVGAYEEGRAEPKIDTIIQIAHHFGLSIDVLLTKEITINELYHFDLFAKGKKEEESSTSTKTKVSKVKGVPLIKSDHWLEYIYQRENRDFMANLPEIFLPSDQKHTWRAFQVQNDEMQQAQAGLKVRDIVLTYLINVDDYHDLKQGEVLLLLVQDQILIRRLIKGGEQLELKADNTHYPLINVPRIDIKEMWKVVAVYSTHLSPPDPLPSKLVYLEQQIERLWEKVTQLEQK
ncbi:MAG: helix-turn-helix domain-containing protein [Candidatus Cyclobacteriaceae bacterium M3_2C_046]